MTVQVHQFSGKFKVLASPDNLIIVGATGDLSKRMLLPSLYALERDQLLNKSLRIICAARADMAQNSFLELTLDALKKHSSIEAEAWARFANRIQYLKLDVRELSDFSRLSEILNPTQTNLFMLAISPDYYAYACDNLRLSSLNHHSSGIIVEKPLGHDLESCRVINQTLSSAFDETRIFRIDHYLGKETVQNLLALRFANTLFEPLWSYRHIEHVSISVLETVGVEGRGEYYNRYGALRDMIQNHVLQLLCLVALEPPAQLDPDAVRNEKTKLLRSLRPICGSDVLSKTVRGQYGAGEISGQRVSPFIDDLNGIASDCETFVALETHVDNWRWTGVPFLLCTGKRLRQRMTEIRIQFRSVPHSVFGVEAAEDLIPNRLTIRLQPEERISLNLMNKTPGLNRGGLRLQPLALDLSLSDAFRSYGRRIAYEQLLLDALAGNQTLFVRRDEIEAAWNWIDGIENGWRVLGMKPEAYASGSDGPERFRAMAEGLFGRHA